MPPAPSAADRERHRQEQTGQPEGDQRRAAPGLAPPVPHLASDQRAEPGPRQSGEQQPLDRQADRCGRLRRGTPAGRRGADHRVLQRRAPPPEQAAHGGHDDQQLDRDGPQAAGGDVQTQRVRGAERRPGHHPGDDRDRGPVGALRPGQHEQLQRAQSAANTASRIVARSRARRDRSPVANALVTARLTATQSSSPRTRRPVRRVPRPVRRAGPRRPPFPPTPPAWPVRADPPARRRTGR